jgi:hypothetical protein
LRGQHPQNVLRVHRETDEAAGHCDHPRVLGTTFSAYGMAYENGKAILYCPKAHPPLEQVFPLFRELI